MTITGTTGAAAPVDDRVLSPELRMDAVTLRVGNLEGMSSYYAGALALEPIEERARATGGGTTRTAGCAWTPSSSTPTPTCATT